MADCGCGLPARRSVGRTKRRNKKQQGAVTAFVVGGLGLLGVGAALLMFARRGGYRVSFVALRNDTEPFIADSARAQDATSAQVAAKEMLERYPNTVGVLIIGYEGHIIDAYQRTAEGAVNKLTVPMLRELEDEVRRQYTDMWPKLAA